MNQRNEMLGDALASLMEAAAAEQQAASKAMTAVTNTTLVLRRVADDLPGVVARQIEQALQKAVREAAKDAFADVAHAGEVANNATAAFTKAADNAARSVWWRVLAGMLLTLFLAVGLGWWLLPSSAELRQRRDELARLEADLSRLRATGIDKLLVVCGPKRRPCAQIEMGEASYGADGDYRILKGF